MRSTARAVVIGGGVGGCSILYWLTRLGWDDVVLVERSDLTSGSTFHSAGLVGQLRSSLALTRMMMSSVELYRTLEAEVGLETGWREVGLAAPRIVARAAGGDHAPGGLGEDVRPAARARLGGGGAGAVPADVDGRRPRSRLSPERRLHRSEPAHVRARRGCAATRRRGQHEHACHGHHDGARRGDGGRHRQGRDRDRHRDQRRRDVRARDRRAGRCHGADHPDGARVPRPRALRPAARHADDARPFAARLLPAGVGWPDHGRLRAQLRPLVARRDPGGLQRQAARGGLAAVRGADGERDRSGPDASKAWAS